MIEAGGVWVECLIIGAFCNFYLSHVSVTQFCHAKGKRGYSVVTAPLGSAVLLQSFCYTVQMWQGQNSHYTKITGVLKGQKQLISLLDT